MTSRRLSGSESPPFWTIVRAREALPKYRFRRPAYLSSWSAYNHLQLCSLSAPFLNGAVVEPPTGERSTGAECDKLSDR
jgi:hypothetical protein